MCHFLPSWYVHSKEKNEENWVGAKTWTIINGSIILTSLNLSFSVDKQSWIYKIQIHHHQEHHTVHHYMEESLCSQLCAEPSWFAIALPCQKEPSLLWQRHRSEHCLPCCIFLEVKDNLSQGKAAWADIGRIRWDTWIMSHEAKYIFHWSRHRVPWWEKHYYVICDIILHS